MATPRKRTRDETGPRERPARKPPARARATVARRARTGDGTARDVSANNPCPFLRALVALGYLPDDVAALGKVADTVARIAKAGDGGPDLPRAAIYAIALLANGFGPLQVARNQLEGMRLDALRGGPFDKKGAGSRILDARGQVDAQELARLAGFGSAKATGSRGRRENGLDLDELRRMMDANFARAAGRRRPFDRLLMDGEWPVLLQVLGKDGPDGRYLSVADVRELFIARRLPPRLMERLGGDQKRAEATRGGPARRSRTRGTHDE